MRCCQKVPPTVQHLLGLCGTEVGGANNDAEEIRLDEDTDLPALTSEGRCNAHRQLKTKLLCSQEAAKPAVQKRDLFRKQEASPKLMFREFSLCK